MEISRCLFVWFVCSFLLVLTRTRSKHLSLTSLTSLGRETVLWTGIWRDHRASQASFKGPFRDRLRNPNNGGFDTRYGVLGAPPLLAQSRVSE